MHVEMPAPAGSSCTLQVLVTGDPQTAYVTLSTYEQAGNLCVVDAIVPPTHMYFVKAITAGAENTPSGNHIVSKWLEFRTEKTSQRICAAGSTGCAY